MKIGIVGAGFVGATAAYALLMQGIGRKIVLVDINKARAQAEADDLYHAVPFSSPLEIIAGDYDALAGASIVILAAGVNSASPEETRLELLGRNAEVFREVVPAVLKAAPNTLLLVATNPVDIMTHLTARYAAEAGVPAGRVIGSGTTLDTARFRALLGRKVGVDSQHVHAYVVGEHGDSEVLTWSNVTIGGIDLDEFVIQREMVLNEADRADIDHQVRNAAPHIIRGKRATYYGIGSALARIVNVLLHDQRAIMTVCTPHDEIAGVPDVTASLPHLIGGQGVIDSFPLKLQPNEQDALHNSVTIIKRYIEKL
ncbi:MAG: L-lactate dehydrogenase [Chloroflexi bacterium OLB15]|nr:MAG: L-lactate dehydrogenase [Chloroflexi bacterium OLB15]